MVLDTSALIAMLLAEPERDAYVALLAEAEDPMISAATLVDASIVMLAKTAEAGIRDLDELLRTGGVRCVAVDDEQARLARDAFARFGKGRSAAGLNYGDCFSYALARSTNQPLLFKGEDFSKTDVTPAINEPTSPH
ncbi:MAG: type II toxin-antitoxin system VapC family toxin [Solirubrobacteraceae bacterium]